MKILKNDFLNELLIVAVIAFFIGLGLGLFLLVRFEILDDEIGTTREMRDSVSVVIRHLDSLEVGINEISAGHEDLTRRYLELTGGMNKCVSK